MLDRRQPVLDLDDLVDLLLIGRDNEPRAAMVQHIGHLFGYRILIQRHRNRRPPSAPPPSTNKAPADCGRSPRHNRPSPRPAPAAPAPDRGFPRRSRSSSSSARSRIPSRDRRAWRRSAAHCAPGAREWTATRPSRRRISPIGPPSTDSVRPPCPLGAALRCLRRLGPGSLTITDPHSLVNNNVAPVRQGRSRLARCRARA